MAYDRPAPDKRPEASDFDRPQDTPPDEDQRLERLNALGLSLDRKRGEAILGRAASGIESEWLEDEEHYEGIDDLNRGEHSIWRTRPPGQAEIKSKSTQSTIFTNITRSYCDAAAARVADMLLPTDDRAWAIKPTPVPELVDISKGIMQPAQAQALAAQYPDPAQQQAAVQQEAAKAQQVIDEATKRAEKAGKRIDDWHVECQYHAHVRTVIEDCGRIGTGILKGPVPVNRKSQAWIQNALVMKEEIKPASICVSPWNFYPDPACGGNIHNGSYTWERDYLTKKKLQDLKGGPGYIDQQIDLCIAEGPQTAKAEKQQVNMPRPESKDEFEIWYYHGVIEKDDIEAAGCDCSDVPADKYLCIPAIVTMVNDRVIKAALSPLDNGELPYDVMNWQKRSGHWAGIGVSRQIRTPQRLVNGAVRNMADNAGLAAGGQIIVKLGVVTPADGTFGLTPRKVWYVKEEYEGKIDDVFSVVQITSLQNDLMVIIQFGLKMAEDVTGLPLILQGQMGKAPDTVGGMTMLSNNASSVLRRIARLFDDSITEPHIRRYYTWLLQYGDDSEKGEYQIDARGSSALVERDLENETITEMGKIVLNPAFGTDPRKWFAEFLKGRRLDPKRFQYTDDEFKQIQKNMAKQPADPRIATAQIRADADAQLLEREQQFEANQNELDRQLKVAVEMIDERMMSAELAAVERETLNKIKARLGETALKLRTQRELSVANMAMGIHKHATPQAATPPTEPKGKAPVGQAFQR